MVAKLSEIKVVMVINKQVDVLSSKNQILEWNNWISETKSLATKEHETLFHENPNYVMKFEI